jgi:hypothetical protein
MPKRLLIPVFLCAAALNAQTQAAGENAAVKAPSFWKRFSLGFRVRGIPLPLFRDRTVESSTTKPAATYKYTTTSTSAHVGLGASLEFRLRSNLLVTADALHHGIGYTQTTTITDTSASTTKTTTITETTRATYWDFPVRVQVLGLVPHTPRRMFVSGGATLRYVRNVRTGNEYQYPDSTTAYNERATTPSKRMLPGAVVGVGFRFLDDFGFKVVPEVRYTRWFGSTFNTLSTHSEIGQVEVLIGITH